MLKNYLMTKTQNNQYINEINSDVSGGSGNNSESVSSATSLTGVSTSLSNFGLGNGLAKSSSNKNLQSNENDVA
jgi:hypothetical protein